MKMGVIDCDNIRFKFNMKYGYFYSQLFIKKFLDINRDATYKIYNAIELELPNNIGDCDVYVILGSKYSSYEDILWINKLRVFIKKCYDFNKKIVGICFGHQLIAHTLGANVECSNKGWGLGVADNNKIVSFANWIKPELSPFNVLVSHKDQVVSLPNNAQLLASSDFCKNFMYSINNTVLGFQGHPELSKNYLYDLINYNKDKYPTNVYNKALQSFKKEVNSREILFWINNFMYS